MIKKLLITGCSGGLGRELALFFAQKEIEVHAVSRDQEKLDELAQSSVFIHPIVADIATQEGRRIIEENVKNEDALSIIHNAAYTQPCPFSELTEENLRLHFETNCIAPLLLTQKLLPYLTKGQRVLHITSGAANLPLPSLLPYCISKAAFQHAAACINKEAEGFLCASLRPGMLDTPLQEKWRETDISLLPNKDYYIQQKEENRLISPILGAEFVGWVMLQTTDEEFSKTAWNIYEESYQPSWLGDRSLYSEKLIGAELSSSLSLSRPR